MMHARSLFAVALVVVAAASAHAQSKRDAIVIYKDGFVIRGKVNESVREVIYDSASGRPFVIPSGNFYLDDHVREIYFSPTNVQKVIQLKPGEVKPPLTIQRIKFVSQTRDFHAKWSFSSFGQWTDAGDREVVLSASAGQPLTITQKFAIYTPQYIRAATIDYKWDLCYFTQEFAPDHVRKMLVQAFQEPKELKNLPESEKYLKVAQFMLEAGWFKEAERELNDVIDRFPNDRRTATELLKKLKQDRANMFVESIEKAANVGQHTVAIDRLDVYEQQEYQKVVSPNNRIVALDLKAKYEKAKADIEQVKVHLKELAAIVRSALWKKAAEFITEELTFDTIGRLDTFLTFAQQHAMDRKADRKPSQTAEEVLAIAVTGWLQGNSAAEPDVKNAQQMIRAREFLLEYLGTDNEIKRTNLLSKFKPQNDLNVDVMARLIRMIPAANPLDEKNLTTEQQTMKIDGGEYLLQLPPDCQPLRPYPVLLILHSGRVKASDTMKLFAEEAAKYGYILAAPQWAGGNLKAKYNHSAKEHDLVLETVRDLRRRLLVDSDRISLFGWEDGGTMAFDVGLSHPDLFASVSVMNGSLTPFTRRFYWPNAQYVPFYVIEGERNGNNAKIMKDLMKDCWAREPYNCIYAEYKGRGSEWYGAEVPKIFDWANRKKRHTPMKEMGRANVGGAGLGEEFRSSRSTDNQFYWLRADGIGNNYLFDHRSNKWATSYVPATFQASLSVGNEKDAKAGAKIWNQANLRVTGAKSLSFWIMPGMMDLSKPLAVRVNGQQVGAQRMIEPSLETLLEELYQSGDRGRLYIAKIDIKF